MRRPLFAAIAVATVAAIGVTALHPGQPCSAEGEASAPTLHAPEATPGAGLPLPTAPLSFAPLVEAASPAVVSVYVKQTVDLSQQQMGIPGMPFFFGPGQGQMPEEFERQGSGSGFVISADGYILTNNHVVEDASELRVALADGEELVAELVGTDPEIDVALIKVDPSQPLPVLELGSAESLRVGDWVVAIGNPLDYDHTVTAGIVSAKGRVLNATTYDDFIQTDASINPGNSGGPLLNTSGEVVGINTAVSRFGQGIAFSVPIDMVKERVEELKQHGRVARGWLGISMQPVDEDLALALGIGEPTGALVAMVHDGTPADEAGLKAGDLILELAGAPIADSNALLHAVGDHRPGDRVALEVMRKGKTRSVQVTLGERPSRDALARGQFQGDDEAEVDPGVEKPQGLGRLGIEVARGAEIWGAPREAANQLIITGVKKGSPAVDKLEEGDILLQLDGEDHSSVAELERALAKAEDVVMLTIQRGSMPMFVAIRLAE
jgi:serine protease Do